MNKYTEIWFCIHVSTSVKVHETNFNKFFENKMAAQNLSQKNPFFFWTASSAGTLPVAILHLEQKTRKILKIYIKMKWSEMKWIFLFFFCRYKMVTGSGPAEEAVQKKRICLREILCCHFVSKKSIKICFMYHNTCRNMYAKPNFNTFIHLSLMKSIKWPFRPHKIKLPLKSMWNTFSMRLSRSTESATETISLALHSFPHALNSSIFINVNSLYMYLNKMINMYIINSFILNKQLLMHTV